MRWLTTIEDKVAQPYHNVPDLPVRVREWIGVNAWWIVLIVALVSSLIDIMTALALPSLMSSGRASYNNFYPQATLSYGAFIADSVAAVIFSSIAIVFLYLAVKPMQFMRRAGWDLLFVGEMIGVLAIVVKFFITIQQFDLIGLLMGLVVTAAELYVLYQIRPQFQARPVISKPEPVVATNPKPVKRAASKPAAKRSSAKRPPTKRKSSQSKKKS